MRANDTQSVKLTFWSANFRNRSTAADSSAASGRRIVSTRDAYSASALPAANAYVVRRPRSVRVSSMTKLDVERTPRSAPDASRRGRRPGDTGRLRRIAPETRPCRRRSRLGVVKKAVVLTGEGVRGTAAPDGVVREQRVVADDSFQDGERGVQRVADDDPERHTLLLRAAEGASTEIGGKHDGRAFHGRALFHG